MVTGLEYQLTLLADVIQKAVVQGVLGPEQATALKSQLAECESLEDVDAFWELLEEEYDVLDSSVWSE
ncbi:hypothetical protein [Haloarcula nitratireducens]|uniref:Uncharacterized protein n=1 Tax=Haloarcula nitratireducens TaxID=2487749 RepID=A0AAW4PDN1_9EURY|nr:hypothetical protein [Halomicroarcula nitratireducens]MBX0296376.1 hypothetical protein [Halomicroarcula nitratireducens]